MLKILLPCCAACFLFVASPINAATATPNAPVTAEAQKPTAKPDAQQYKPEFNGSNNDRYIVND
ncbi:MAG: hypothetical protein Q8R83_02435 [Legionellaceae bacterium]|nr:hypothetical protein [Legionellaceae bacterium]